VKKEKQSFEKRMKTVNPSIIITGIFTNQKEKVECRCGTCGYEWPARPDHLLTGVGCPKCAKREKYTDESYRGKLRQVNPNIILVSPYEKSSKKALFRCRVCDTEWMAYPSAILNKTGRSGCHGQDKIRFSQKTFPETVEEVNKGITIKGKYRASRHRIECECSACRRDWEPTTESLLKKQPDICRLHGKNNHAFYERYSTEIFTKEVAMINPHIMILGEHKRLTDKMPCRCRICGAEWSVRETYLLKKYRCPGHEMRSTKAYFEKELSAVLPNIIVTGEYRGINNPVACKCGVCGYEWTQKASSLKRGKGCPECRKKKIVKAV